VFLNALSDELSTWPFQILIIPRTKTQDARGHLLLKLEGIKQLRGAQNFLDVIMAVNSPYPEIKEKANTALESLRKAASAINGNPVADQMQEAFLTSVCFMEKSK